MISSGDLLPAEARADSMALVKWARSRSESSKLIERGMRAVPADEFWNAQPRPGRRQRQSNASPARTGQAPGPDQRMGTRPAPKAVRMRV